VLALFLATVAAQTSLTITVWPQGRAADRHRYALRCDPVGGTLPKRGDACAVLERLGAAAFAPVPKDAVCTQQYGGPAEAVVAGRHRGRTIWVRFRRRDGCEIARWNKHAALLPR